MNDDKILIDSSIWIEYFKNNDVYVSFVENALDTLSAYIAGPVVCELLQGVKSIKENEALSSCIDAIPFIDVSKDDWVKAGDILYKLRKQGITIPMANVILGAVCLNNGLTIITLDKHFEKIPGIRVLHP